MHMVKLVDSIAAVPTTRLNLSDGTIWRVTSFDAPPPRLRRSMSQNAMTDGGFVSSSQYEMRTIKMSLFLSRSSEDANATQLQTLARELDRATNYLMYQPVGATKPVFFRTLRSDMTSVREVPTPGGSAQRVVEVEVLAEPFALGLRETLGPYTVNNDPAAGSNGCYFDVTGVIGDVAVPFAMVDTTCAPSRFDMAVRQHDTPSSFSFFFQAESMSLFTDTTNPGGGPDAAMSGTGTNNYVRTTFATGAAMTDRLIGTVASGVNSRGVFRVLAAVRRSDASSVIQVQAALSGASTEVVTLPLTTNRQLVDLGVVSNEAIEIFTGNDTGVTVQSASLAISAARVSGAGTLDWDVIFLIPADEAYLKYASGSTIPRATGEDFILDGDRAAGMVNGADPFTTGAIHPYLHYPSMALAGSPPRLIPNVTNRIYLMTSDYDVSANPRHTKADTEALTLYYFPRYLYVRPATT